MGELLRIAGFEATDLLREAESLLLRVRREPLAEWLPLIRYASYGAWSKLKGEPLSSMWHRVAAEVLLRAHEDLAAEGTLEPLPDVSDSMWRSSLHDRLTPRGTHAQTLDRALTDLGLSPHPRVVLLVEGETELEHLPQLLAEFAVTVPGQVRVQATRSSQVNPQLLARYSATPRVGKKLPRGWHLDAPPTAIFVVMDPENSFDTQPKRDKMAATFKNAIRQEVEHQGAVIGDDMLDALVHIQVWGDDKYELANFADNELVPAITRLAINQTNPQVGSDDWEPRLRQNLQKARKDHDDIKVAFGPLGVREDKVGLAKLLWPVLRARCEREYTADTIETPVLKIILEVRALVWKLTPVNALAED